MAVQMKSTQGAVAQVADESVDAFTKAGWTKVETKKSSGDTDKAERKPS